MSRNEQESASSATDDNLRDSKDGKKHKKRKRNSDSGSSVSSSFEDKRKTKKKKKKSRKKKAKHKKRRSVSSDDDSVVENERLKQKLEARGETLEERNERRAKKRAAHIANKFGYTAESNPFNDPNLHEKFTWKKAERKATSAGGLNAFEEIEKVRSRRTQREQEMDERERARAEESRMREQEHFDEWAAKEEAFHLQQQRQRSAIRLVEGREKPIDVLAKNVLMFGLTDEEQTARARVKYQERYSALNEIKSLDVELQEPSELLKVLKMEELRELRYDVLDFYRLEKEATTTDADAHAMNPVLKFWANIQILVDNEIRELEQQEKPSKVATADIASIFVGQTDEELHKMKVEIVDKLQNQKSDAELDRTYWTNVLDQLSVHVAKKDLSHMHSRMLVRQLEKLEATKADIDAKKSNTKDSSSRLAEEDDSESKRQAIPNNVAPGFGDQEAETTEEVMVGNRHSTQENCGYRKPRYFNRVRTGYDWNKYNQTHYDQDNPPPKIVQGYKFNIFYPDLDPTISPRFTLEAADTDDFCIIRFSSGPPYEDIAFKIVNREWNRSRKKGYRCTFERGILSLYFNFTTHWYRK